MVWPLIVRDEVLGAVTFVSDRAGYRYTARDLVEAKGSLAREQQASMERISASIRTALDLIEDLVAYASSRMGKLDIRPAPTDIRELVQEITDQYRGQVEGAGLALHVDLREKIPLIRSDRIRPERQPVDRRRARRHYHGGKRAAPGLDLHALAPAAHGPPRGRPAARSMSAGTSDPAAPTIRSTPILTARACASSAAAAPDRARAAPREHAALGLARASPGDDKNVSTLTWA